MLWEDIPIAIDDWVSQAAAPAYDIRRAVAGVPTASHVGFYYHPDEGLAGVFAPLGDPADLARVKSAVARATGDRPVSLSYRAISAPTAGWVKVAYSQTLHRAGELLNFFPGQYPGGVPNYPSPVAAMLTSGLVGAGLGWGGGKLLGALAPEGTGKKLSRTGMILGGLMGAAPGAMWGLTNQMTGRAFNDPSLLQESTEAPDFTNGTNALHAPVPENHPELLDTAQEYLHNAPPRAFGKRSDDDFPELCEAFKTACEKAADAFGVPDLRTRTMADVNIDALGRTLWDTGAPPALAATTMAGMYAAQQLPDPDARPGWATGRQLAELTANTVGDYATGTLVGAALNAVVGTPLNAKTFGLGNAALGLISTIVPKLFGR